jgi:hypothetical protein
MVALLTAYLYVRSAALMATSILSRAALMESNLTWCCGQEGTYKPKHSVINRPEDERTELISMPQD